MPVDQLLDRLRVDDARDEDAVRAGARVGLAAQERGLRVVGAAQVDVGARVDDDRDAGSVGGRARRRDALGRVARVAQLGAVAEPVLEVAADRARGERALDRLPHVGRRLAVAALEVRGDRQRHGARDDARPRRASPRARSPRRRRARARRRSPTTRSRSRGSPGPTRPSRALAASHTLTSTRIAGSVCSRRSSSARALRSSVAAPCPEPYYAPRAAPCRRARPEGGRSTRSSWSSVASSTRATPTAPVQPGVDLGVRAAVAAAEVADQAVALVAQDRRGARTRSGATSARRARRRSRR